MTSIDIREALTPGPRAWRGGVLRGCAAAIVALWGLASAHGAEPVRATLAGEFHESVQEEVKVSGSVVVGVAAASALSGPATLSGLIIPATSPLICLTVLSRDGVYYSRNAYQVPAQAQAEGAGFALLPFEKTRRRELIGSFGPGEIAVRATPSGCDDEALRYLVPAGAAGIATVDVLINAFGATDVYYRIEDGAEGDCEEFLEGRRTSYDYRCEIPAAALGAGRHLVYIDRERYGRPLAEVQIELDLGSAP